MLGPVTVAVGPGVFIPRPETELLLEWGLAAIAESSSPLVVDLCTGSAALALAVAGAAARTRVVHAVEADPGALTWARHNIAEHVAAGGTPVILHAADVRWQRPAGRPGVPVDLVLCNPPYVPGRHPAAARGGRLGPARRGLRRPGRAGHHPRGGRRARPGCCATAGTWPSSTTTRHGESVPALLRRRRVLTDVAEHRDLAGRPRFATARRIGLHPGVRKVPAVSATFDCSDPDARADGLAAAARAVRAGSLVVLPTDTVYGLGCDAFSAAAVRALLAAKNRGPDMPVPVLVGSWSTIDGLVLGVPRTARDLIEAFWPGGLSLVLPHAPSLAWDLGSTKGTVMLRMPLHPVALELLRDVGPMAVSSANVSGQPPASTAAEAQAQLGDTVTVYLDGGPSGEPVASTIVDLTGDEPRILRAGAVTAAELAEVLGREPHSA